MRIAVVGAGELGANFGSTLVRGGEDVTFIVRPARLPDIEANGLPLRGSAPGTTDCIKVRATASPESLGVVDLILFCVKTYDLEEAALQIRPIVGPGTVVIPVQNGIDYVERIGKIVGHDNVIGGTTLAGVTFGEMDGRLTPRVQQIADVFKKCGLRHSAVTNIREEIWKKLAVAVVGNAIMALVRLPLGPLRDCEPTCDLMRGAANEVIAVASKCGVNVPADYADAVMGIANRLPATYTSSMYRDIMAGRRIEIEDHCGAVVRLGRQHGVPVPLNFAVYAALKPWANGKPSMA